MGITFVSGRCGAGKSRYIRAQILKRDVLFLRQLNSANRERDIFVSGKEAEVPRTHSGTQADNDAAWRKNSRSNLRDLTAGGISSSLFIVPQQYTVQAERDLIGEGLKGLFGVEVLSFSRLTHKILSSEGGRSTPFLDATGKCLKAQLALDNVRDKLTVYDARTLGLPKLLSGHFDYFQRFDIDPSTLSETVELLGDGYTKRRLTDIALVYDAYRNAENVEYGAEDLIDRVIDEIPGCAWLKRSHVFIDGFEQIDAQTYRILSALMQTAEHLTITFCMDAPCADSPFGDLVQSALFKPERAHFNKCMEIAADLHITPEIVTLPNDEYPARHMRPQFAHLERHLFDYDGAYDDVPEGIEVYQFTDPYAEADYAAAKIIELTRNGLWWRDIAVVCGNSSAELVERVFREYDIPCFMDRKRSVTGSAIAELALSVVKAVSGWNVHDILCMLKTGLTGISDNDCEVFENYCVQYGIKPGSIKRPFKYGDFALTERVREAVVTPLLTLNKAFQSERADVIIDGLVRYFEQIALDARVDELVESLPGSAAAEKLSLKEILTGLYELLQQIKIALGSAQVSAAQIYDILLEGFLARESAIIPTGMDEVLIADMCRSKLGNIKALFLLDAADGKLPAVDPGDGLVSARDIDVLMNYGVKLGRTANEIHEMARFQLYQTICKPDEYIWLSISALNLNGEEQRPSVLFDMLKQAFPKFTVIKNVPLTDEMQAKLVCAPKAAARHCVQLADKANFWADVRSCLMDDARTSEILQIVGGFAYQTGIGFEAAKRLYSGSVSVTGIETYFQCPFRHFMSRGIRPAERVEYGFERRDVGSFLHAVMEGFTVDVVGADEAYLHDETFLRAAMDKAFDECATQYADRLGEGESAAHILRRLHRIAQSMVVKLMKYFGEGNRIAGGEISFDGSEFAPISVRLDDGSDVSIQGKVDRIDVDANGLLLVADYKTGDRAIPTGVSELKNDLYNGIRLQLAMYTNMALQYADVFGASSVSGMEYISLRDEIEPCKINDDLYENAKDDTLTRKGISLNDKNVTPDVIREWLAFAMDKSKEGLEGIFSGDIAARPIDKNDICTKCDYRAVCGGKQNSRPYEKVEGGLYE